MRTTLAIVALLAGCESSPHTPTPSTNTSPTPKLVTPVADAAAPQDSSPAMQPLTLTWELARAGDHLHLTYAVHNTSTAPVFLLDRLVIPSAKGLEPAFERAIVHDGDGGAVAFARAYVAPSMRGGIGGVTQPVARRLDANQTITGEADVPLPIVAWHNFAKPDPLATTAPTRAYLEIGYLVDHDKWASLVLVDGTQLSGPAHPFVDAQKLVRSDTRAIP